MRMSLLSAVAMVAAVVAPEPARSQSAADWPNKSVRVLLNFAPGGSLDNSMRPISERLSKTFGQQFVLEHRGGASGAIGLEAALKAVADGYTFVTTPGLSMTILPHLRKVPYDPLKDFLPVTMMTAGPMLFAVHPSFPAKTVQEVIAHAKANPGKVVWGTAGVGTTGHLLMEMVNKEAGVNILHVPYRGGGESLADFLAGVFHIHADPNTLPHIAAGKGRLLAVSDVQRLPDFPDVPLLSEFYPAIDPFPWFGMFAPPGTPDPIIRKLAEAMIKIGKDPELAAVLRKVALRPTAGAPEEMTAQLKKDHDRYGKIIRDLGIKAE